MSQFHMGKQFKLPCCSFLKTYFEVEGIGVLDVFKIYLKRLGTSALDLMLGHSHFGDV